MPEAMPPPAGLAEVVQWRSAAHGARHAFTFLADGESVAGVLSYAELDRRARAIAAHLQERAPGKPVLLCYPSGLEFVAAFVACFYAGALAIPAYPPRNRRHVSRVRSIVADSGAPLVLSAGASVEEMREWLPNTGQAAAQVCDTAAIADADAAAWKPVAADPRALAYLQYTSGSTSAPKGVMVSHENLLRNAAAIEEGYAMHPGSLTVSWLPLFHDMGLVLTLVAPLVTGTPVMMMTPAAFVQRPLRWLEAVSRFRATHSGGPNFAFDLVVDRTTPQQRAALDLCAWETCYTGSEPVRKSTVDRFNAAFAASGFAPRTQAPGYGLAEATLMVSRKQRGTEVRTRRLRAAGLQRHRVESAGAGEPGIDVVGCGSAALDTRIEIVDPRTARPASPGHIGEIWVQAPGVALGYWRNERATEESFGARLAGGEGPFLRSGDLGFVEEGELYITGRIKDVVILRGRNHYPHDIELTAQESHAALERGNVAAFGVTVEGEERLAIVQEVSRTALRRLDAQATLSAIRQAVVEEHEVEVHDLLLVAPLEVPKTSSGKVQRSEARSRYLADSFKVLARYRAPVAMPLASPQERMAPSFGIDAERRRAIERWLAARLAALRGLPAAEIGLEHPFASFGIDSILAVRISGELQEWLQRPLAPTLLYEHPHIRALARHLASADEVSSTVAAPSATHEPIAIVGMGCRFPGARSPQEFWEQLRRGADLVGEAPGRGLGIRAGFIDEVDRFDADFFGIAPREAEDLDPQQRLLLEVAWCALEDAGIAPTRLAGTSAGVFMGVSTRDYAELVAAGSPGAYFGTGTAASGAAGRLSYVLGLEGPSLVVDTACSSSLVALHLAAQSLRSGECRVALAGGVNVILTPALNAAFTEARMLSPRGRCSAFDASADGYVRGEGCGVLVLKRLADAMADGDRVLAVVRGSAVNQDGRSNGLTAPNAQAQERVVRAALEAAGVAPGEVGYVEAHGTGTPLGDPIEVQALGRVFGAKDDASEPAYLGSVKTNIGHLEAAAGVAGLIKTVLALQHGEIPAHLHFERPSAMIAWERLPFSVPVATTPWPSRGERRVAGVSSFGFVGTNAHVVVEAAPGAPAMAQSEAPQGAQLLCLSAHTAAALDALAERYLASLGAAPPPQAHDLCASAAVGRAHLRHRIAVAGESIAELAAGLEAARGPGEKRARRSWHRGERSPGDENRVVFLFTGQGSQYAGMARGLYAAEPAFRRALDRCAAAFGPHLRIPLLELVHAADGGAELDRTAHTQPALFAVEWALAEMWRAWGLEPSALIGHSIGEYVAACVAGVFTLEEGAALVAARGRAMQALPSGGVMVAAGAGEGEVREAIGGEARAVSIAAVNGPAQCVVSGEALAVERVQARLEARGFACERLNVSHAFHSPLMRPALDEIERAFEGVRLGAPRIPIFANVSGRAAAAGELEAPRYWLDQVTGSVRFADCVRAALEGGYRTFVEAGPHPTLTALAQQTPAAREATWAASLRRGGDDRRQVREAQALLYARGVDLDWEAVHRDHSHARVALPGYPFQRRRFWTRGAAAQPSAAPAPAVAAAQVHPVLGAQLPLASARDRVWVRSLSLEAAPWLADHQVDSSVVYPGAAFIECALLAAREALATDAVELRDLTAERPLVLERGIARELQTHLTREGGKARIVFHGRDAAGEWSRHGAATALACDGVEPDAAPRLHEARARCPRAIEPRAFYEAWRQRGNRWGPAFQGIVELSVGAGEALARIEAPAVIAAGLAGHRAHPAILDACGQALAAAAHDRAGAFVIKSVARARFAAPLEGALWSHASIRAGGSSSARTLAGDVSLFDAQGKPIARFEDVRFEFLGSAGDAQPAPERWVHATEWIEAGPLPVSGEPREWVIVHAEDEARSAALLAGALAAHDHRARLVNAGPAGEALDTLCDSLLHLLDAARSVAHARGGNAPRLLVLTRGAWKLPGDAPGLAQVQAALAWGLGRTLAVEHSEFATVLADLDPCEPEAGLDALAARLHADAAENELAVRGTAVRVPRLAMQPLPEQAPPAMRRDGACLITGGMGALGLQVARSLVERGCRHLVLAGRTPLPPRVHWRDIDASSAAGRRIAAIVELENLGANVHAVALDVSDEAALASWHESWRREVRPPIRAVIHAAGVVKRRAALELDRASLRQQLEGKVLGALALERVFGDEDLDAFVLFSSASAVLGSPQLGAYAAANAALDAIARARRARGATALSVQWGAWAGAGMAQANTLAAETLDPAQALRILAGLWNAPQPVLAVLPIAWDAWAARNPSLARAPLLANLTRPHAQSSQEALGDLARCTLEERRARIAEWLREQASQVLRIAPAELDARAPLTALGLDSLMALELRNRITAASRVALPLVELIRGATLAQIAEAIEQRLGEAVATALEPVPQAELAAHPWPLSPGQESLWLLHSLQPKSPAYHVAFAARVCSPPDVQALRRAWRKLRERHAMLRAQWSGAGTGLVQRVRTTFADSFEAACVAGDEPALEREALAAYRRPFELEHGEPARLHLITRADDDHVLLLVVHHMACDGWSLWILVDELRRLYVAECAGVAADLPPLAHSYVDFIAWQRSLVEGAEGWRQWEHWSRRLAGELPTLDLPTDRPRPPAASGNGASIAFTWPAALRDRVAALAHESKTTAFTVLAAGLAALLNRYTQQDDLLIGMPAAGRTEGAFAHVVGHFVNEVILRADLSGDPGFATLLERVRESVLGAMAAQDLPFPLLVQRLRPDRDRARSPLFQVNFVYQQAQQAGEALELMASGEGATAQWGALELKPHELHQQEGQFDLTVELHDTGERLGGLIKYDPDLFDAATIERLATHYANLLEAALADPRRRVSELALLSQAERARELAQPAHADAATAPADDDCLHRRFERAARAAPDAIALVFEGERLTYAQLDGRADRLAGRLRRLGVGPDVLVALLFEPGLDAVVAILGVLKAGGGYLPLDTTAPGERLAFMLEDSRAPVLITRGDRATRLPGFAGQVVDLDRDAAALAGEPAVQAASAVSSANVAYCIYTSGTTGRPKGVLIEHRQVTRLFDATGAWYNFDARDVWTLFHSYAFDFSVWEIWGALLHGGRLVVVPRPTARAPDAFHALLVEEGVTVLNQTPSAFRELIAADERSRGTRLALRLVIFGGEALDAAMLQPWIARHGGKPRLVNMYGITETTVHVTYAPVASAAAGGPSRIGIPIPDLQAYVLDRHMQPVPAGVRGELYVGGAGLARGYLRRAALTAERFVPDPFGAQPGARLYRTGDLARRRADGTLEYLGRIDRQVKIRGFRIERGEIEAVLRACAGVRDALVLVRPGAGGEPALYAYVARAQGAAPEPDALRREVRAALPEYMVPAAVHVLDAYPLTVNGKIDEAALAALGEGPARDRSRLMPSTPAERTVAAVWSEVLSAADIGAHDNFFELGGHSLLVPRVYRRLQECFDTPLAIVDLFRHATVAELATHLEGLGRQGGMLGESEERARLRRARRGARTRVDP